MLPRAVPIDSPLPPIVSVLPRPGPEIEAEDGPLAAAAAGRRSAAARGAAASLKRVIASSFRVCGIYTAAAAALPCARSRAWLDAAPVGDELLSDLELLHGEHPS